MTELCSENSQIREFLRVLLIPAPREGYFTEHLALGGKMFSVPVMFTLSPYCKADTIRSTRLQLKFENSNSTYRRTSFISLFCVAQRA